jgi:hypothetical protein
MTKSPFTGEKPWILLTERSPHGPRPITLMADGERIDNNLPYYVRSKENRATRAATVKMCDAVGTHLICPREACRRGSACADRDLTQLPFCAHRYRETIRHAICLAQEYYGLRSGDARAASGVNEEAPPQPFKGKPLLQIMLEAGAPREVLERPTGLAEADWGCEREPSALANVAEMRHRRLARQAKAAGKPPPPPPESLESIEARMRKLWRWSGEGTPPWRGNRAPRPATSYLPPRRPSS